MKFGKNNNLFIFLAVFMLFSANVYSLEKIQSAPVINLEDISPTFEEEKDELEKMNEDTLIINETNTENVNTSSVPRVLVVVPLAATAAAAAVPYLSPSTAPVLRRKLTVPVELPPL